MHTLQAPFVVVAAGEAAVTAQCGADSADAFAAADSAA
jgi:hypothetical protein